MAEIRFLTPIEYGNHATSFHQKLIEKTDFYFYLGGRKVAEVIPGNIEKNSQGVILKDERAIWWKTALKVASYFTIILPVLILLTKLVMRKKYHFHTYPHETPKIKKNALQESRLRKPKELALLLLAFLVPSAAISYINKKKAPMSQLGLKHKSFKALLKKVDPKTGKKVGEQLEHLEVKGIMGALEYIKHCPNLKTFIIEDRFISNESLSKLADRNLPKLETLSIKDKTGCKAKEGIEALAVSDKFPNLKELKLYYLYLGQEGIKAFAGSNNFTKLENLTIKYSDIDTLGLRELASSPNFPKLKILDISDSSPDLPPLADSPHFPDLEVLKVGCPAYRVNSLINSQNFPNLRILKIKNNTENDWAREFARLPHFPKLERVDIYELENLKEIESLMNSPHYPNLKWIGISADEGEVKRLSQSPNFYKLHIKPRDDYFGDDDGYED